jgi:hypothetical protein
MWWKFKSDMENGNIDLSAFQTEEGYFDDFKIMEEEVLAHTFRVYNGKLIVLPKDELRKIEHLGRSPDFADALVIWNWARRDQEGAKSDPGVSEYEIDHYSKAMFKVEDGVDE